MNRPRPVPASPPPAAASAEVKRSTLASLSLRKHDRLNLELKLEHPAADATRDRVESLVDVWFFLPPAIGITAETYGSSDFYGDLRVYTRLKTPDLSLSELARLDGPRSPLASLATLQQELPAGRVPSALGQTIRGEARLLCCIFRRAARNVHARLESASPGIRRSEAREVAGQCDRLLRVWREQVDALHTSRIDEKTRTALRTCDEALSLQVEALVSRILLEHGDQLDEAVPTLVELATDERKRRADRGDRSGRAEGASDRAAFWDQASLLKKYVSQALFLVARKHNGQKTLEHLAKAVAAALAMAWTVALQVGTVLLLGLELNSSVDVRVVVLFSLIAVGGYIFKDRIMDTVGKRLAGAIPRLLYDRRLDLYRKDDGPQIGQVRERVRFASCEDAPADVRTRRVEAARTPLALWTDADCLHYQRRVFAFPRQGARTFPRIEGLTDILRINLSAWIRTLDSRRKSIALVSSEGGVSSEEVPNHYLVDVVARISSPGDGALRLESWRLVLTRRGLVRVDDCPLGDELPRLSSGLNETRLQ